MASKAIAAKAICGERHSWGQLVLPPALNSFHQSKLIVLNLSQYHHIHD